LDALMPVRDDFLQYIRNSPEKRQKSVFIHYFFS